jgi:hypothetical protein
VRPLLFELVPTAADGLATLHPGRWKGKAAEPRMLVAAVHADPLAQVRTVELAQLPAEPLELVLGATGVLDVTLVDAAGEPVDGAGTARLDFQPPEGSPLAAVRGFVRAPFVRGRARFTHAPVGVDLVVRAHASGAVVEEDGLSARIEAEGEERALEFCLNPLFHGARVRLLAAPGEPLAETPLFVRWPEAERGEKITTDAQGILTGWVGLGFVPGDEMHVEFTTASLHGVRRAARVAVPTVAPGLVDLGDVVLAPAPLLASGVVVDELGQPLVRAVVEGHVAPPGGGQPPKDPRAELFAVTDLEGRFALYGLADGQLFLGADHDRAQAGSKVPVEPGTTDVRLALQRQGAIEARVRFDEGLQSAVNMLAFKDGRCIGRYSQQHGRFVVADLAPGKYALRCVWGDGGGAILGEVADVVVRPGETTRDPRCDPLDLAGKVHAIALQVHAPSGAASEVLAVVHESGGKSAFGQSVYLSDDGRGVLRSPWPVVDLELRIQGLRTVEVREVRSEASATFEPGFPMRLALDAAALEELGERTLDVRLAYEGAHYPRPVGSARFDAAGKAELRVCDPGTYNVQLELSEPRPDRPAVRRVSGSPQRVEVPADGASEVTLDLGIEYVRRQLGLGL